MSPGRAIKMGLGAAIGVAAAVLTGNAVMDKRDEAKRTCPTGYVLVDAVGAHEACVPGYYPRDDK